MIDRLAVSGYRSLRDIRLALGRLTIVTGPNGSGKSSL
jgi:AAA15 family ATPase/GTPase